MTSYFLHHAPLGLFTDVVLPSERATPPDTSFYWLGKVVTPRITPTLLPSDFLHFLTRLGRMAPRDRATLVRNMPPSGIYCLDAWLKSVAAGDWPDETELIRKIEEEKLTAEKEKELLFEEIRSRHFPDVPSRQRCLFAIEPTQSIDEHMRTMNFVPRDRTIVELEPMDGTRILRAESKLLNCNSERKDKKEEKAIAYWRGAINISSTTEILLEGPYRILRIRQPAPG